MKKNFTLLLLAFVLSSSFKINKSSTDPQKAVAMVYIITMSNEKGYTKNDLSEYIIVLPKSIEMDRVAFVNGKMKSLKEKHKNLSIRKKSLTLKSNEYLCKAIAHGKNPTNGEYEKFYYVKAIEEETIEAKAEKEAKLYFPNIGELQKITYTISQPFQPTQKNYWETWFNSIKTFLNETGTQEELQ